MQDSPNSVCHHAIWDRDSCITVSIIIFTFYFPTTIIVLPKCYVLTAKSPLSPASARPPTKAGVSVPPSPWNSPSKAQLFSEAIAHYPVPKEQKPELKRRAEHAKSKKQTSQIPHPSKLSWIAACNATGASTSWSTTWENPSQVAQLN